MVNPTTSSRRLVRAREGKILCGVAQGIANYLDVDVFIIRLVLIGLAFVHGVGMLLYFLLCILLPMEAPYHSYTEVSEGPSESSPGGAVSSREGTYASPTPPPRRQPQSESSIWVMGVMLIVLGFLFLADNLFPSFRLILYWPWLLVAIGLGILLSIYLNTENEADDAT